MNFKFLAVVSCAEVYQMAKNWNDRLSETVAAQNVRHDSDLPYSMQRAINSSLPSAVKIERLLRANHGRIKREIYDLLYGGYKGIPMGYIDEAQNAEFQKELGWGTIWLKLYSDDVRFAFAAKHLPTLQRVVDAMGEDLVLLQVSIFWPPVNLNYHYGISKGVYRYHYPIAVPDSVCYDNLGYRYGEVQPTESTSVHEGSTGMILDGTLFKWKEGEGVIFDDTLLHTAWNTTPHPRIVLFGDLHRDFDDEDTRSTSRAITKTIAQTEYLKSIQEILAKQGVSRA